MQLTLEEIQVLSEVLEKEEARLHQVYDEPKWKKQAEKGLRIISMLQRKLEDLEANLTPEEQEWLEVLLLNEMEHIHGHGPQVYSSIIQKIHM